MIIKTSGLSAAVHEVTIDTNDLWRLVLYGMKARGFSCDENCFKVIVRGRFGKGRKHSLEVGRYSEDFRGRRPLKTKEAQRDE